MADDKRNDKSGRLAADETEADVRDVSDGELSDDELSEAGGGRMIYRKTPDEDTSADGRLAF